ncbi:hypothetical protein B0H13DRAFT_2318147 [Mycena leptocephala]|nr:hypothetical protein B0H13DRAFT_2318147 [Mycena leptocephala]
MFAPSLICAFHPISLLIADVLIPRKPTRARPGYVSATFCGSSPQAAFLSTRSLARPRTRLPPVPCAPLALVVLLPLLRRPSSSPAYPHFIEPDPPMFVPRDGDGDQWRGYAGLIRVLLAISPDERSRPFPALQDHMRSSATATSYAASCHCVVLMHLETALSGPAVSLLTHALPVLTPPKDSRSFSSSSDCPPFKLALRIGAGKQREAGTAKGTRTRTAAWALNVADAHRVLSGLSPSVRTSDK